MKRLLFLFCVGSIFPVISARGEAKGPNVVFILSDDQRWDTIGALGNKEVRTPNLDKLVERGFHFTNAYCMGSMIPAVCTPSRTMIATGRSLWHIPDPNLPNAPEGIAVLPGIFRAAGYATFHCGKKGNSCRFANAAFEENIETTDQQSDDRAGKAADEVIAFIERQNGERPFLAYFAPPCPHDPRNAPDEYMKMYTPAEISLPPNFMPEHPFDNGELDVRDEKLAARPRDPVEMKRHLAEYDACITYLDAQVGRIMEAVERKGFGGSTVVVFSSDQGLSVGGMHGLMGKQNLYEEVKPPLIFAGAGIPKGESPALVYLFDLFPTLCDLAGLKTPDSVEGKSLAPIVRGETRKVRDTLYAAYRDCQRMVRDERWKLIEYNAAGVRNTQLFDLENDPNELDNVLGHAKATNQGSIMRTLLMKGAKEFGDPAEWVKF